MALFGLTGSKTKSKTSTDATKKEILAQSGSEATNSSTAGSQEQTSQTTNQSQGTTATNQAGTELSNRINSTVGTGTQTTLDSGLVTKATSTASTLLDSLGLNINSLNTGVNDLSKPFDKESFVNSAVKQAEGFQATRLDELLGSAFNSIGGTDATNSMAALLSERARNDASANVAGVRVNAQQTAEEIARQNLSVASGVSAQSNSGFLTDLINAIKGGQTQTSQAESGTDSASANTTSTGSTSASESSSGTSAQQSVSLETVASLVNSLLNSQTDTTLKEVVKAKGSSLGVSLGGK